MMSPGFGSPKIEGQRLFALVVEQVPQGPFVARLTIDPWPNPPNPVAIGRLNPHHASAEVGQIASGDDHRLVRQVENNGAVKWFCVGHWWSPTN